MRMSRWISTLALVLMVALAWLKPLDQLAHDHTEAGFKRALAAFAVARTLNAVISVLQGTEVTGGAVVNVTVALGQVLDPVNDLVEQFSKLMLVVSVVFSAQLLLIKMGAGWVVSLLLTGLALVWLVMLWRQPAHRYRSVLSRWLFALLLVRFLVPVSAMASEWAYERYMAEDYAQAQQTLKLATEQLRQLGGAEADPNAPNAPNKPRWWEVRELLTQKMDELKAAADRVVGDIIDLMVVFVMQTVVLPLLMLLLAWWVWRSLLMPPSGPAGTG